MKYVVIGLLAATVTLSSAQARGGKMPNQPTPYDYTREKKKDYKKDYCMDAIGNHVYCQSVQSN